MAGSILNPRLGAAVCQGDGDERRPRVVDADGLARLRALEQGGAVDAGRGLVLVEGDRAAGEVAAGPALADFADCGGEIDAGRLGGAGDSLYCGTFNHP
ncbi:hypothetical protein [Polyangium mundeleinium]|uniref:Uncharacterized protein n=1 Tax=Polyangium mundeleinium TaxID=2995306 RepID=A0ABT5EIC5_9BACT|nr:hypothetical protein [Polyangium mundeleinium]MDC0741563.1 hypothetical protein [Polyangium mundeleinium]